MVRADVRPTPRRQHDGAAQSAPSRIPLNTFAIAFGLAGLADVWSDAAPLLHVGTIAAQLFWLAAAVAWVWLIVAHLLRGRRTGVSVMTQLVHPVQGPLAALVPVVGMVLAGDLLDFWELGAVVLGVASMAASAVFAAWLISTWTRGRIDLQSVHGGYLLPTVAAGFIAAYMCARFGARPVAVGAFGVASFFWIAIFTVIVARLATCPALPAPLTPTMAILMAPPAVAARAWFAVAGDAPNDIQSALAALALLMVLVQIALLGRYRALPFSLGFWSFTFPVAAVVDLGIVWLALDRPVFWRAGVGVLVVLLTFFIAAIAVRSLHAWRTSRPTTAGPRAAEVVLERADDQIVPVDDAPR